MPFPPPDSWQQMAHALAPHLDTDPRLKHFLYQYLLKVSNICPADAARFHQPLSPFNPPGRGSYHRFYHTSSLLLTLEHHLSQKLDHPLHLDAAGVHLLDPTDTPALLHTLAEQGRTPSLQHAAALAARHDLGPLPAPLPGPSLPSPSHLLSHPLFLRFRATSPYPGQIIADLLAAAVPFGPDRTASHSRILLLLEQALSLDLSVYAAWAPFEACLDLLYEELLLQLLLTAPYSNDHLEHAIQRIIAPPAFHRIYSSGMAAHQAALNALLAPQKTVLLYDGCYFENRAALLKSHPLENIYLVTHPDYDASLDANIALLKHHSQQVDLLFVSPHENLLKGRMTFRPHDISAILQRLHQTNTASPTLTVVVDTTIDFLAPPPYLSLFPALTFVLFWSHQKFDLFGTDKLSGGSLAVYSSNAALLDRFRAQTTALLDPLSRQGLSHFFTFPHHLEERRRRLFANASYVNERITLPHAVRKQGLCFSVDIQFPDDRELSLMEAFHARHIPLMVRGGFGYNLTTVAFTTFHMARFAIGLEPHLDQFIDALETIAR